MLQICTGGGLQRLQGGHTQRRGEPLGEGQVAAVGEELLQRRRVQGRGEAAAQRCRYALRKRASAAPVEDGSAHGGALVWEEFLRSIDVALPQMQEVQNVRRRVGVSREHGGQRRCAPQAGGLPRSGVPLERRGRTLRQRSGALAELTPALPGILSLHLRQSLMGSGGREPHQGLAQGRGCTPHVAPAGVVLALPGGYATVAGLT